MTKYIGRLVNLGLARESVRGTPVAPTIWVPKANITFFDRASKLDYRQSYGTIGHGAQAPKILEWAEGAIEGDILDQPFGYLLYAAFGTLVTTGPSDSAYTHTFSLQNDSQHDSLTIAIADPDRTDYFSLAMLDKLEISMNPDDVVQYTATFKARSGRQQPAASPSYSTYNKFLGRHTVVKIATVVAGLGAATAINIKNLKLTINKNAMIRNALGTIWPDDILNGKFDITGEFEIDMDDQTYRNLALETQYRAMRIQFINTDVLIGVTSRPQLTIDLAKVFFEAWERNQANDEIVSQKVAFRALFDTTTSTTVNSCVLINAKSSYSS